MSISMYQRRRFFRKVTAGTLELLVLITCTVTIFMVVTAFGSLIHYIFKTVYGWL